MTSLRINLIMSFCKEGQLLPVSMRTKPKYHAFIHTLTGSDVPTLRDLDAHIRPLIADAWYYLGLQLLDSNDVPRLHVIKANNPNDASAACIEMFSLWLQMNPRASWNSLISAIKSPGVGKYDVAHKIEQMLQPGNDCM